MEDLLRAYGPDPSDLDPSNSQPDPPPVRSSSSAPPTIAPSRAQPSPPHDPSQHIVYRNPTADALSAPLAGPAHPTRRDAVSSGTALNHPTGNVEDAFVSDVAFSRQFHTFNASGSASDPSGSGTLASSTPSHQVAPSELVRNIREQKRKRQQADEAEPASRGTAWDEPGDLAPKPLRNHDLLSDRQKDYVNWWQQRYQAKRDKSKQLEAEGRAEQQLGSGEPSTAGVSSTFHGEAEHAYDGRPWIEAPKDRRRVETERCFVPSELEMELGGHSKGVSAIRIMPPHGNLLLSSSFDAEIKIWDIAGSHGTCMRTYHGHSKGVRDISFSHDGRKFASCGYDRVVRLWDTETGKCVNSFTASSVPKCIRVHPDSDKADVVLAGLEDARVVQYDMATGDHMQDYSWHTKPINSITFVDENRRFVTTSDDRTMRAWEYGINVQIKYIAEPSMHAMPAVAVHPSGKYMSAQSLDNRIVTYAATERFRFNGKKTFKGHINGGFPCEVCFSRDGRYIASGDSTGSVFFWSWSSTKLFRKLKCHSRAAIGCEWHPLHPSRVATCSWDGSIKLWR